jgi:hypothetical protein
MVSAIQIQQLVRNLNLKNEKNAIFFLLRLEGWIRDNKSSKKALARGINKILNSIHQQEQEQKTEQLKKINLENIKNNFIIKYAEKIIELHEKQGLGARKIEKYLWENHRAKVSHSTISRFLKQQKQTIKKEKKEIKENGKFKGWKFRKANKRCILSDFSVWTRTT